MKILSFFDLTAYNSFGICIEAALFVEVQKEDELKELLNDDISKQNKLLILGGGSNILFTNDFDGLVINNKISGIEVLEEDDASLILKVGAGVVWHHLVEYALEHNLGGIENLSLIPGSVGAAPIQNIGAYGVELKEVMLSLDAINLTTGVKETFSNKDCEFGYRDSIFKNKHRDSYVITSVLLKLTKHPKVNTSYGAISSVLEEKGIASPTIQDVSEAIITIRTSKLPDPKEIGNAGSFFKNPVIDKIDFEALKLEFPEIPGYVSTDTVKVPAAWLIDQCGWKGVRKGNAGVHEKQPLVMVNHGGATGKEILDLANEVRESVTEKFGIDLEAEPRII